jgi:glycosyltransferase involved in cell wall biosynthesis
MSGISEWKNPILLAKASDALHAEFPGTEVHFYGACDVNHPYGSAFLDVLKSRPWCISHGNSKMETLLKALSEATCAVLPSKQENFGLALAEAMAAGVPCIGSNAGGIPDVIVHNKTGLLFENNTEASLASCLLDLHRNRGMADALAIAGREDARQRFTAESIAVAHVRMYQELLNGTCTQ